MTGISREQTEGFFWPVSTLWQSAAVACVSVRATRRKDNGGMTTTNAGKARWARAKASSLSRQAIELDRDRTGSWEDRARRRRAADHLRNEAARFDLIARRLDPILDDQAA